MKIKTIYGFTLLEMLVVLGIIASILGVGLISYSSVQKKARDTKRKQDLKTIQNALEQYYSVCNYRYPLIEGNLPSVIQPQKSLGCQYDGQAFIVPRDPLGGIYQCLAPCNNENYTICPPDLGGGNYLETENCTDRSCCFKNQQ